METTNDSLQTVSYGEVKIAQRSTEIVLSIPLKKWRKLKNYIKEIDSATSFFQTAASVSWGVAGSAVLAIIPYINPFNKTCFFIFLALSLLSLGFGFFCVASGKKDKNRQEITKDFALNYMNDFEEEFIIPED